MGCGCGGGGAKNAAARTSSRVTAFQVIVDGAPVGEFDSLPEARAEAGAVGGLVKVVSKSS